jgi:hypothetical protein
MISIAFEKEESSRWQRLRISPVSISKTRFAFSM